MKWDLSFLYKNREEFLKALDEAKEVINQIPEYKGKLNDKEKFREYYLLQRRIMKDYLKTYLYANCKVDQDRRGT